MFIKAKNIDTAFRHIRLFCLAVILTCLLICCYTIYKSFSLVSLVESKVYVLANGKALEAVVSDRKENLPVEAKDHIKTFHQYFFTLSPDDKLIEANINSAMYLGDGSVKRVYDDLKESSYYNNIISGNVSQNIQPDSISVNITAYPYFFRYYGHEQITRATTVVTRSLITEGYLRSIARSDNNPHGFLIEKWQIIANKDITIKNR